MNYTIKVKGEGEPAIILEALEVVSEAVRGYVEKKEPLPKGMEIEHKDIVFNIRQQKKQTNGKD